jgi:hypothetical protein
MLSLANFDSYFQFSVLASQMSVYGRLVVTGGSDWTGYFYQYTAATKQLQPFFRQSGGGSSSLANAVTLAVALAAGDMIWMAGRNDKISYFVMQSGVWSLTHSIKTTTLAGGVSPGAIGMGLFGTTTARIINYGGGDPGGDAYTIPHLGGAAVF